MRIFLATDLRTAQTYIVERSPKRHSSRLIASTMPAKAPGADTRIPWSKVPLHIRRAATQALKPPATPPTGGGRSRALNFSENQS